MGHGQDSNGQGSNNQGSDDTSAFDWVNAWAAQTKPDAVSSVRPLPADQLIRDVAEIERARDRLAAIPATAPVRRTQALTLAPARTADPVPVLVGGVLALVMLTVFGAAAAMSKLSR